MTEALAQNFKSKLEGNEWTKKKIRERMSDFENCCSSLRVNVNRKGWEIIQSFTSPHLQREDHSSAEEKALAPLSTEIYQEHAREFQSLFIKLTSCEPFQNDCGTLWTRERTVFYQWQQRNRLSTERRRNSATVLVTTSKQSIFLKVCRIMILVQRWLRYNSDTWPHSNTFTSVLLLT